MHINRYTHPFFYKTVSSNLAICSLSSDNIVVEFLHLLQRRKQLGVVPSSCTDYGENNVNKQVFGPIKLTSLLCGFCCKVLGECMFIHRVWCPGISWSVGQTLCPDITENKWKHPCCDEDLQGQVYSVLYPVWKTCLFPNLATLVTCHAQSPKLNTSATIQIHPSTVLQIICLGFQVCSSLCSQC